MGNKNTDYIPEWTDDDLLWYHGEGKIDKVQWWEELNGNGDRISGTLDKKNPLLWTKSAKGDPKLKDEPFLWEILRRHPDIGWLRTEYNSFSGDEDEDEHTMARQDVMFKELLEKQVGAITHRVMLNGDFAWPDLDLEEMNGFKVDLLNFLQNEQRPFPPVRFDLGRGVSDGEFMNLFPEESFRDETGITLRHKTVPEIKKLVESTGGKFVTLLVDPSRPRHELKGLIVEESMRQIFGEQVTSNDSVIGNEDDTFQRRKYNITEVRYSTLARLDRAKKLDADLRRKAKALFAPFSLPMPD